MFGHILEQMTERRVTQVVFEIVQVGERDRFSLFGFDSGRHLALRKPRLLACLGYDLAECLHSAPPHPELRCRRLYTSRYHVCMQRSTTANWAIASPSRPRA